MLLTRLMRDNLIFDYAVRFAASHPDLKRDFAVDEPIVADFKGFLGQRKFAYDEDAFGDSKASIELRLRSQIARVKWGQDAEAQALADGDMQLQKALTLFDEAARLAKAGEKGRREKEQAELLPPAPRR